MRAMRRRGRHLHRRIFLWFGVSIALTFAITGLVLGRIGHWQGSTRTLLFALGIAAVALWAASGVIARRLAWPLVEVIRVARDIGQGKLSSRVSRWWRGPDEIGALADTINDMAERIEKQMADQRALLAAVSHELRTPLAHMRVIAELARSGDGAQLGELEREIADVDRLVDQLLASSRLEFETLELRPLDAADACVRALERADIDAALLDIAADDTQVEADAMLISRALGNVLENAQRHGERVVKLQVGGDSERLSFSVTDRGPGFDAAELDSVFESFYRGQRRAKATHGSLGLGLALVRRIAEAHGGRAWARNVEGGAEVGFDIARRSARGSP